MDTHPGEGIFQSGDSLRSYPVQADVFFPFCRLLVENAASVCAGMPLRFRAVAVGQRERCSEWRGWLAPCIRLPNWCLLMSWWHLMSRLSRRHLLATGAAVGTVLAIPALVQATVGRAGAASGGDDMDMDQSGHDAAETIGVRPVPFTEGAPQKVVRGGSWRDVPANVSCTARDYFLPGQGGARHIGFRCCL